MPLHDAGCYALYTHTCYLRYHVLYVSQGALSINLATGAATTVELPTKVDKMNIHGALMAVAWVLLLPLGSLAARHRSGRLHQFESDSQ